MSASEKKGIVQFIQFILVGVLNTLVDLVVTRLLQVGFGLLTNQLLLTYYIPKVIGYACGIVYSYVLNTAWTFQKERKRDAREIISFLIINALTLGVSLGLMFLFRNVFGLSNWWNNVISIDWILRIIPGDFFCTLLSSGIALVLNFLGNKLIVFAKRKA